MTFFVPETSNRLEYTLLAPGLLAWAKVRSSPIRTSIKSGTYKTAQSLAEALTKAMTTSKGLKIVVWTADTKTSTLVATPYKGIKGDARASWDVTFTDRANGLLSYMGYRGLVLKPDKPVSISYAKLMGPAFDGTFEIKHFPPTSSGKFYWGPKDCTFWPDTCPSGYRRLNKSTGQVSDTNCGSDSTACFPVNAASACMKLPSHAQAKNTWPDRYGKCKYPQSYVQTERDFSVLTTQYRPNKSTGICAKKLGKDCLAEGDYKQFALPYCSGETNGVPRIISDTNCKTWCRENPSDCYAAKDRFCRAHPDHDLCRCINRNNNSLYQRLVAAMTKATQERGLPPSAAPDRCWFPYCKGDDLQDVLLPPEVNEHVGKPCPATQVCMAGDVHLGQISASSLGKVNIRAAEMKCFAPGETPPPPEPESKPESKPVPVPTATPASAPASAPVPASASTSTTDTAPETVKPELIAATVTGVVLLIALLAWLIVRNRGRG
jgi:hypothetical protein